MDSLELKVPKELLEQTLEKVRVLSRADRKAKCNQASLAERAISATASELKEIKSRNKKWQQDQDAKPGAKHVGSKYTSNKTHYSPVDPDAKIAVKPGKPRQLCYLNQLCVDSAHHVITHTQADSANRKDSQCLPRILEALLERMQALGLGCQHLAADAGYSCGENYALLEKAEILPWIPPHGTYKGGPAGFSYQPVGDYWLCPNNKKVIFRRVALDKYYNKVRRYLTSRSDCTPCPLKASCIGKGKEKRIDIAYHFALYNKAIERIRSPLGRRMKAMRQSTVEPVFGTLINFMGLRRINSRGIAQAEKTMLMAASAYNLKKWLYFKPKTRKTAAQALPVVVAKGIMLFLLAWMEEVRQTWGKRLLLR
jgi:hypothetical protein